MCGKTDQVLMKILSHIYHWTHPDCG